MQVFAAGLSAEEAMDPPYGKSKEEELQQGTV
jgi:hypothetical protein